MARTVDPEQVRRRIRAARIIAGFDKVDDLALTLNIDGLKRDTLYEIESGKRAVRPHELRLIAEACGISPAFFEVDFAHLNADEPVELDTDERLERLEGAVILLVQQLASEQPELQQRFLEALRTRRSSRRAQSQGEAESARGA